MPQLLMDDLPSQAMISPMTLADRLLCLAEDADRAGFSDTAERLLQLVYGVFDETPGRRTQ
jgi:hypothetical protein